MYESTGSVEAGSQLDTADIAARLLRCDPAALNGAELVDAVAAAEAVMSAVAAFQMRALAALAVPGMAGDPTGLAERLAGQYPRTAADDPDLMHAFAQDAAQSMAAGEVAAVLRISPVTAGVRVRDAIRMCTDLPATLQALSAGVIDRGKARVIAEHTVPLPCAAVATVERWCLPVAANQSTAATRRAVTAAVIAVDPRGAQERHDQACRQRDLVVQPGTDGMSTLKAYVAADGAVSIFQLADLLATHTMGYADDDRSVGERRVDAWTDLAGQILTHGHVDLADYLTPDAAVSRQPVPSPTDSNAAVRIPDSDPSPTPGPEARASRRMSRQGRRPHLQVTLGLSTLAGIDDLPADLAGYGAVTAGMARSIAASAGSLCSLLADPETGAVLAAGAHTYRPRQDLRDRLAALADSCRFPSCRQPVWRCDIDHRDRFDVHHPADGGRTTLTNTDPLCRRHHLFKHHAGWTLRRDETSTADPAGLGVTWRSPTGHVYRDPARQVAVPAAWTVHIPGDRSDDGNCADGCCSGNHDHDQAESAERADHGECADRGESNDRADHGECADRGESNDRADDGECADRGESNSSPDHGECTAADGAGSTQRPEVGVVSEDHVSWLLREHLRGRYAAEADPPTTRPGPAPNDGKGERNDDLPPF